MRLHFPALPMNAVLHLPDDSVERLAHRHVGVLAGLVGGDDLAAGHVDVHAHLEQVALALVAVDLLDHHMAAGDPGVEIPQLRRQFLDTCVHRRGVLHAAIGDLGLSHVFQTPGELFCSTR